jgi:hypothetical protein
MTRTKIIHLKDRYSMLLLSPRIGLLYRVLKRPGKNGRKDRIQCAYFGFEYEKAAQEFATQMRVHYPQSFPLVREGERLEYAWEVKIREFETIINVAKTLAAREVSKPQDQSIAA